MGKKRINNDILLTWVLVRKDGVPEDLSNVDNLRVFVRHETYDLMYERIEDKTFRVENNVLSVDFLAREQKHKGKYGVFATWQRADDTIDGGFRTYTTDFCNAFELVAHSCQISDEEALGTEIESVVAEAVKGAVFIPSVSEQGVLTWENDGGFENPEPFNLNNTGDKNYVHEQRVPSDTWVIYHYLDKKPSVTVIDSAGTEVEGEVEHVDNRSIIIRFSGEFTGIATLN